VSANVVEVAFVVVDLNPVKFCSVEEAFTRRLVAVRIPLSISVPPLPLVKNKLVVEPVVVKKVVVVALVDVELSAVKFCNVLEARVKIFEKVPRPVEVRLLPLAEVKKRFVEEATEANKLVVVAFVAVALPRIVPPEKVLVSLRSVDEAAVIVILAVPLNEVPLIVRAFCRAVAVPAFPEILPVIRLEKVLFPLNVLLSPRRVVDE